jgi:type IV pilus assembly protein PilM
MANEIQRSLDFYAATAADSNVDKIVASGGTAAIPSLIRTVSRISGVPAEVANPFRNINYDERKFSPDQIQQWAPVAGIAVGLALRRTNER